ncbi:MAG: hypothetical protein COB67_06310 [SAR324 cluster bacterium]|uniref:Uncharacterized protein n=1 Tax=SAR324 cluster bacterium TaxID=2024889 RepID=A0A2A4T5N4_9DELT|nr:MAG: hypothetical protein COB67_06310 [SAR324 cluster bacterium]
MSFWRDEEVVQAWCNLFEHRDAQRSGRSRIFKNYRLRVANVVHNYGLAEREQAPKDSQAVIE